MSTVTDVQRTATYYFEAHVTLDPVPLELLDDVEAIALASNFKVAKLLMDKGVPSQLDTFMTGHATRLTDLVDRTRRVVAALRDAHFEVRRYKIEDTLLDSRIKDELELLV